MGGGRREEAPQPRIRGSGVRAPIGESFDAPISSKLGCDSLHLFAKSRSFFGGKDVISRGMLQGLRRGAKPIRKLCQICPDLNGG